MHPSAQVGARDSSRQPGSEVHPSAQQVGVRLTLQVRSDLAIASEEQSTVGVILGAPCNYIRTIIQLFVGGGSIQERPPKTVATLR